MNHKFLIFFLFIFYFSLAGCKSSKNESGDQKESQSKLTDKQKEQVPVSKELLQLSQFFSGKLQKGKSESLEKIADSGEYESFKKSLNNHWALYSSQILTPLSEWRNRNIPPVSSKVVFYPFSGPDFPNAYFLYPDADVYILVGLEAGGHQPDLVSLHRDKIRQGMREFISSLDSITRLNFYMTNKMKKNISASVFKGTSPVFLSYFGLMGIVPCSLRSIDLESDGSIKYLTKEEISNSKKFKSGFVSLEIIFNDPVSGKNKYLYYFSKNISNSGLENDSGLLEFVKKKGDFVSTFKAASFLIHYNHFSKFKDFILDNANVIIMDDTGPRVKELKKGFDLKVFGRYSRPINLWPEMYQKELMELHKEQKPDPIKFRYGYGTLNRTYHILYARRKEKIP